MATASVPRNGIFVVKHCYGSNTNEVNSIPIHHTTDPDEAMQHFDGEYNSPREEEIESFAAEYTAVHAAFAEQAVLFLGGSDRDGVSLSPASFAATRKIGMVLDEDAFQNASLTRWLSEFVAKFAHDYMITVDTYCGHGQVFLCFTKHAIWAFGD